MQVQYRPEIDGLRAIAVVPVILFHAGFEPFGGGFVGVDVFFVISGYLITSIILCELNAGTFSIARFYERRARRILPALFLVMAASSLIAWIIFLPNDLLLFSKSLIATTLFSSNVLFWNETGYFDTAAELKPLLHTWSLAVEEQYYIVFPLFLLTMWRYARARTGFALALIGIASLIAAEWGVQNHPEAAFFLLPFRLWELVLGAYVALHVSKHPVRGSHRVFEFASAAGLALILWAVFAFGKATPFPGLSALVPTVGTALIIVFATRGTLVGRLLGSAPLVGIGLISYSAYLWHQPLLAFARYTSLTEPPLWMVLGICALTFFLAYLSWRFVELPFRQKTNTPRRTLLLAGATCAAVAICFGQSGVTSKGFEASFVAGLDDRQQAVWRASTVKPASPGDCHFNTDRFSDELEKRFVACAETFGPGIVVLGDSHGRDLFNAISLTAGYPFVVGSTRPRCRPHTPKPECHYDAFETFLSQHAHYVGKVLYNQAGFYLVADGDGNPGRRDFFKRRSIDLYSPNFDYIDKVSSYLQRLAKYTDVIWVGPRLEPHVNVQKLWRLALACRMIDVPVDRNIGATFRQLDRAIAERLQHLSKLSYVSTLEALSFSPAADLYDCSGPYWTDGDHWNTAGEQRFGPKMMTSLQGLWNRASRTD